MRNCSGRWGTSRYARRCQSLHRHYRFRVSRSNAPENLGRALRSASRSPGVSWGVPGLAVTGEHAKDGVGFPKPPQIEKTKTLQHPVAGRVPGSCVGGGFANRSAAVRGRFHFPSRGYCVQWRGVIRLEWIWKRVPRISCAAFSATKARRSRGRPATARRYSS